MSTKRTPFGQDPTSLYDLLVQVLHCVVRWIEASTVIDSTAGAALDTQVIALSQGWRPSRTWARAIRAAVYLADQVVVPLRAGESLRLELKERRHSTNFSRIQLRMRRPNQRRSLDADYHDGNPGLYPVALYCLYVMPGGARDILSSGGGGHWLPCTMFYVPDTSRSSSCRLDIRSLHRMLLWCLRCAAPELGVTEDELRRAFGRPGDIRRAVACHLFQHLTIAEVAHLLGSHPQWVAAYYRGRQRDPFDTHRMTWSTIQAPGQEGP